MILTISVQFGQDPDNLGAGVSQDPRHPDPGAGQDPDHLGPGHWSLLVALGRDPGHHCFPGHHSPGQDHLGPGPGPGQDPDHWSRK